MHLAQVNIGGMKAPTTRCGVRVLFSPDDGADVTSMELNG
jgi:hypothetical protein